MGFLEIMSMLAALALTLGLFGVAVWAWRRFAPASLLPNAAPRKRRMNVVETLVLGTNHRLVLLGEGRLLEGARNADRPEDKG